MRRNQPRCWLGHFDCPNRMSILSFISGVSRPNGSRSDRMLAMRLAVSPWLIDCPRISICARRGCKARSAIWVPWSVSCSPLSPSTIAPSLISNDTACNQGPLPGGSSQASSVGSFIPHFRSCSATGVRSAPNISGVA